MNDDPWKKSSSKDISNKGKTLLGYSKGIWIWLIILLMLIIARNIYLYSPLFKDLI